MKNKALNYSSVLCVNAISFAFIFCSYSCAQLSDQTYPIEMTTTTKGGRYKVVDTGQKKFFNNSKIIPKTSEGQPFYAQDAQYIMNAPSYIDNGDGTIADQVTGLMWQKAYKVMTYEEAVERIKTFNLVNHMD